jgi:flagellar hook assembly protein FlgD
MIFCKSFFGITPEAPLSDICNAAQPGIAVLNVITTPVGITQPPITESPLFLMNYPNPLTSRTCVSFSLVNEGLISLTIYDVNGKVVRDLVRTFYKSGTSCVEWDGCDNHGSRVSPGIYICRIIEGNESKSILVIKQ